MRSHRLWQMCSALLFVLPSVTFAQSGLTNPAKPSADGSYEVPVSDLKKLDSSPGIDLPHELSAYEIADTVAIAVTISPDGRVRKAKAISGKVNSLKAAAEKAIKNWSFQPYLVNGTPVPIHT